MCTATTNYSRVALHHLDSIPAKAPPPQRHLHECVDGLPQLLALLATGEVVLPEHTRQPRVGEDVRIADGQPVVGEGPEALAAARVVVLHKRDGRGRPPAATISRSRRVLSAHLVMYTLFGSDQAVLLC
jgi:hypothetical protein